MPGFIHTRFAATTRGIITRTFGTGTTQFTVPTSVNRILTASGKGGDGQSEIWVGGAGYAVGSVYVKNATGTNGAPGTWESLQALGPGASGSGTAPDNRYNIYSNGNIQNIGSFVFGVTWRGGVTRYSYGGVGSGTITYPVTEAARPGNVGGAGGGGIVGAGYWWEAAELQFQAAAEGANSTGFGLTFPGGGVGAAAILTNFTNILVTPGAQYSIVNNSSTPITITY